MSISFSTVFRWTDLRLDSVRLFAGDDQRANGVRRKQFQLEGPEGAGASEMRQALRNVAGGLVGLKGLYLAEPFSELGRQLGAAAVRMFLRPWIISCYLIKY